ncbi:MAG TPA: MFS transporter, partial [Caulobacteraceae bacterium]|nr:MFS transporter [Caulobacteraceae bacterium]
MTSTTDAPPPPPQRGLLGALGVFFERRIAVMLGLGFAAGLPNFLIFDTLSAWLRAAGLSLAVISLFSLATLPYSFKFLWAPLVDRTAVPVLTRWLGHRRSWMVVAQLGVTVCLALISTGDPATGLGRLAAFAALAGFCSATQDIVVDAWRIEAAEASRQGAMAAAYQWGYRIANIVAGAAPLFLADRVGWHVSYAVMAAVMGLGLLAVLGAPREAEHRIRPIETGGLTRAPLLEPLEWLARLALLVVAAVFLASGLGAKADILAAALRTLGAGEAADWLMKAWTAKPNGVWLQLLAVLAGFATVVIAVLPIPRVRTRP